MAASERELVPQNESGAERAVDTALEIHLEWTKSQNLQKPAAK
ncbi:MAG: hypothetical protein ACRD0G_05855 [Acidimicrobiales bacterium]